MNKNEIEIINKVYCKLADLFNNKIGNLNTLLTTDKDNLVDAINEIGLAQSNQVATNYVNNINIEYGVSLVLIVTPSILGSSLPFILS